MLESQVMNFLTLKSAQLMEQNVLFLTQKAGMFEEVILVGLFSLGGLHINDIFKRPFSFIFDYYDHKHGFCVKNY